MYFCCICSELDIHKLLDYLTSNSTIIPESTNEVLDLREWSFKMYADVLRMFKTNHTHDEKMRPLHNNGEEETRSRIGDIVNQEIFIFEFGSAVFWGFSRGKEAAILAVIRKFIVRGTVARVEFDECEDDMAFVASSAVDKISIGNDVIVLPDETLAKQRLAVSYAIAQSTVLGIFEARIEKKMEDYKYIPETLAAVGSVHLEQKVLGKMIGEIFVIRHDVNLHSDILDTPDFFWEEDKFEPEYKMVMRYLEMGSRVEVLNKRVDLLRELLDVLQEQMEANHAVALEWIVIWLVVIEVLIGILGIIGPVLGLWK